MQVLTCPDGVILARNAGRLYTLRKLDVPKATRPKPRSATWRRRNRPLTVVLGAGFVADLHLRAYEQVPKAQVIGIVSDPLDAARKAAEHYGIPKVYASISEAVSDSEVQVVDICLPNFLHAEAAMSAARNGKHVICEKPLARTVSEAERMLTAAEQAGVIHCYAESEVFRPDFLRMLELREQGLLGRVLRFRGFEGHSGPHSPWFFSKELAGGGALLDCKCYPESAPL